MIYNEKTIEYTMSDFDFDIKYLANQIKNSGNQYIYIVGLVRGGLVPSVYLSHLLNLPLVTLNWSRIDKNPHIGNESNCWIPEDTISNKVLVVDDIVDSGETIKEILQDWKLSNLNLINLNNINVCSLVYNDDVNFGLHTFTANHISRTEEKRWFLFPWENNS